VAKIKYPMPLGEIPSAVRRMDSLRQSYLGSRGDEPPSSTGDTTIRRRNGPAAGRESAGSRSFADGELVLETPDLRLLETPDLRPGAGLSVNDSTSV
jgi:hypothetical protein